MIVSNHFIWVHVPKTGGTWLRDTLLRHAPPSWQLKSICPGHRPASRIPECYRQRPRLYVARNPWDWHLSYFSFWSGHAARRTGSFANSNGAIYQRSKERHKWWIGVADRRLTFEQALPEMLERNTFSAVLDCRVGVDGEWPGVAIHFEGLRANVLLALMAVVPSGSIPESLIHALRTSPPKMTSSHKPYTEVYSEEMRELVAQYDARAIDHFGYGFGTGPHAIHTKGTS